ncbi:MAG: DcaP family trimeric outer membrane transporter [Chlorobium sp.]
MNERGKLGYALMLAGSLLTAAPCFAAETLTTRMNRLERELAELKQSANAQREVPKVDAEAPKKSEVLPTPLVSTSSGTKIQLYGFARFDASYDDGKINPGNIALWAWPEGQNSHDGEWNLTAGATRLGLNLSGPDTEKIKLTGNIEFDFLGGGSENNMNPRMRHAYFKAYWPASDFSILAGQTWDLHSSLIPFVDDSAIMWASGNIGTRHPQVRLTKGFSVGEKSHFEIAVAAARTIGEKNSQPDPLSLGYNTDPGKDAQMPTIQGRIAFSAPLLVQDQPTTLAFSGHYGQEEWDTNTTGAHKTLDSWSGNVELSLPLCKKMAFAGEYFTGANLDDYWGGIAQGVNQSSISDLKKIRASGGWAALKYAPSTSRSLSIGAGIDKPNEDDLALNARSQNQVIFARVLNNITPSLILGFQVSNWKTDYKGSAESNVIRTQGSLTYKF